ncbi:hypothetical protein LSH36_1518g00028 [Paralvinella palmiformis]|uniref:YqaJ viral recombinase domain-containing protein n=1 Tax=Paralvinella palmiformis TaxID=53620 RepID=A0AAD9MNP5_9ANNE|nr:hypothetical protein LSH36_1518g00028 [Paralvinella palmiformis]
MYPPANIHAVIHNRHYLEKDHVTYILEHLQITSISDEQIHIIELETRGQSTNIIGGRKGLFVFTQAHTSNKLCQASTLIHTIETHQSRANHTWGNYEGTALNEYIANKNVVVRSSGIVVCRNAPYLACSPDGLVGNGGLVEVECPYTARDQTVSPISVPYLDGRLAL